MKSRKRLLLQEFSYVGVFALVIALIFVLPFLVKGNLVYGDDLEYQLSRIKEITGWLKDGVFNFPGISTRSFYSLGYGVNIFYPWATLLPFSVFGLWINNPVIAIYLGFYVYTFGTVLIAYYCMKRFSRSWVASIAFSILYTFSTYRSIDGFTRFALAEFIALTFLPLIMLGSYEVLFGQKRYWVIVTIGFSLIVYTHVLTAFLACLYLFIFWGISLFFINERVKRSLVLFFSGIVAIFASAGYLFGFVEEQIFQSFLQPSPMDLIGTNVNQLILSSLYNDFMRSSQNGTYNVGLICILILIIGVFFWKAMNTTYRIIYGLGIVTLFMTTNLFPWSLVQGTPLGVIQFPFRLLVFPTLFACITGANLIKIFSEKYSMKIKSSVLVATLFICVVPWSLSANAMLIKAQPFKFDSNNIFFTDSDNRFSMWIDQYMPEASQKHVNEIYQHVGYLENNTFVASPRTDKQSLIFKIPADRNYMEIDLPIIRYKNTTVFVNGKNVPITSSYRGTVQLIIDKGMNSIKIEYQVSSAMKLGFLVSIATWILLIIYFFEVTIKKKEPRIISSNSAKKKN